jgi:hypothetical protein
MSLCIVRRMHTRARTRRLCPLALPRPLRYLQATLPSVRRPCIGLKGQHSNNATWRHTSRAPSCSVLLLLLPQFVLRRVGPAGILFTE